MSHVAEEVQNMNEALRNLLGAYVPPPLLVDAPEPAHQPIRFGERAAVRVNQPNGVLIYEFEATADLRWRLLYVNYEAAVAAYQNYYQPAAYGVFDFPPMPQQHGGPAAAARADELLRSELDPEQLKQYDQDRTFYVVTPAGTRYHILPQVAHNVHEMFNGRAIRTLCFHPVDCWSIPIEDTMLAQKLWLEAGLERQFRAGSIVNEIALFGLGGQV